MGKFELYDKKRQGNVQPLCLSQANDKYKSYKENAYFLQSLTVPVTKEDQKELEEALNF